MIKQVLLLPIILSIGFIMIDQPDISGQSTEEVTGKLYINPDCGLSVADELEFPNANHNSLATKIDFSLTNSGDSEMTVLMWGSHWTLENSSDETPIIFGNNTAVDNSDVGAKGDYDDKISVNATNTGIGINLGKIAGSATNSTDWQVDTTLISGQEGFTGNLEQTLTLSGTC